MREVNAGRNREVISLKFSGAPTSLGVSIGKTKVYKRESGEEKKEPVESDKELGKVRKAISKSIHQITQLREETFKKFGESKARIFDAHLLILDDPSLKSGVEKRIIEGEAAEVAVREVMNEIRKSFSSMKSEYMRERVEDIEDIKMRILGNLRGAAGTFLTLEDKRVIVAKELFPSDTVMLKDKALAFVTEKGGKTSHVSIIARTMDIPCVVGIDGISAKANDGDTIIVDGNDGTVIIHPTQEELDVYQQKIEQNLIYRRELEKGKYEPAVTRDSRKIEVTANVGRLEEVPNALEKGADGIGLLRTEFLFLNRKVPPSEDEIIEVFREIGKKMGEKPVIVRTLDVGADKLLPYIKVTKENNPFLGVRGIRLCFKSAKEIFKGQLRAIIKARKYCNIKVMFPMISTVEEVKFAKKIFKEVAKELGVPAEEMGKIELGIMIETPSAALISDSLAEDVDFFSIGTNDLTQYTLAADRTNENLSELYNHLHPSVIMLMDMTIRSAHKRGKWVGVCGEIAGDFDAIPLLIGLGVEELSVAFSRIPEVKNMIRKISVSEAKELARNVLKARTISTVKNILK